MNTNAVQNLPTAHKAPRRSGGLTGLIKKIAAKTPGKGPGSSKLALRADLSLHQREVERLRHEMRTQVDTINNLKQEKERLIQAHNLELVQIRKQLANTIDTNKKDTKGKVVSTEAQKLQISSLRVNVESLNKQITRAVDLLVESFFRQPHGLAKKDASRLYEEVVQSIGEPIARMLVEQGESVSPLGNSFLVNGALQVVITDFCAAKIELWVPHDPMVSRFLTTLYAKIQDSQSQSVAGQWRSLTQQHTSFSRFGWKEDLVTSLMKVVKIASWGIPDQARRSFEDELAKIFKAVEDLRFAIGDTSISVGADIQLSIVSLNTEFAADRMVDAFANPKLPALDKYKGLSQCVIGTTCFGLNKVTRVDEGHGPGKLVSENMLSPSVMLETTIRDRHKDALTHINVDNPMLDVVRRGFVGYVTGLSA